MPKTRAVVITGYHKSEAEFGSDVTSYYRDHRLKHGRNISFYPVQSRGEKRPDLVVPEADAELRDYFSNHAPPDVVLDVHVGAAEYIWPKGTDEAEYEAIDILCAKIPAPVVYSLSRLLGCEHVISDVLLPHEVEDLSDLDQEDALHRVDGGTTSPRDWTHMTIAKTGLPTVSVEPYLFVDSVTARDPIYWHRVHQLADLINTMYDAFEDCRNRA